ncbi:MAG: hypothetical protein LN566_06180 [Rickettsia endosymbiont of Stiretrus anchorago]|nr:hypothetical protein [Rickettsia endosymbiont of Stiretrus anchorago]
MPTTTKNFVYTEHLQALLSSIAKTKKYQGENITDKNWQNIFNELNNYDHFLHIKLQKLIGIENKNLIDAILKYIGDIKSLEFIELCNKVQLFLENNFEHYEKLFESAEKISNTSYPLTKEYFLYRYVAKAILYKPNVNYAEEFNKEKEIHLNFVRYISSLKQSYFKLEKAKEQFNEEHKINSWLIEKSNSVSNHSGKIALTYSTLITGVILLRSYVFDEEEPLYKLCALPTTILAILQLLLSFPSTILSSKQTKIINYNLFKELESKTNDESHFEDIKFLFDNTPTFSDNLINTVVICFRYAANLLLQPIDLLNNDTVNYFITYTALRWLSAAGVVEEQSKVTGFMHNKLLGFLHNKIVPALIENKLFSSEEIKPYFYVLFKHLKKK